MAFEGYVDALSEREIRGWIYDDFRENDPVTIEVLAGDRVISTFPASVYRADLQNAGKGNGWHGFSFTAEEKDVVKGVPLSVRVKGKRWKIQPTAAATGREAPHFTDPRRKLMHTLEFGHPEFQVAFTEAPKDPEEARVCERLIEAFHRTAADDPDSGPRRADVWTDLGNAVHGEVLKLLKKRDVKGLAEYMRDAHSRNITWGITQGIQMTAALRSRVDQQRAIGTEYLDNLVSLAEWMTLLDVESPHQQGQWGENIQTDPQALVDRISERLGFPIETPPAIGSYFGLLTRRGVVTGRDLAALYCAMRTREIADNLGIARPDVCEIGGGMGGVAYYCARMGMPCTVIDIPMVSLLQGYFLLRALPDMGVQLYGEPESDANVVRLMPTYAFADPKREYDILVNQDSFPEMNPAYSIGYLQQARKNIKRAFYSINQEARAVQSGDSRQTTVPDMVREAGFDFRRWSRHRHWLRAGYVEEIYVREAEPAKT